MFAGQEEYFQELLILVKKEISLYTKYAVRLTANGSVRHVYQTKLFREELANILQDPFAQMARDEYERERENLFMQWHKFHEKAYRTLKESAVMLPFAYLLRRLGLTDFEQYLACLAIAPELNREFERMYAYLQDDLAWRYPSLDLSVKMYSMDETVQNALIHRIFVRRELLCCVFGQRPMTQESEMSWQLKFRKDLIDFVFFYEADLLDRKMGYHVVVPGKFGIEECNINREVAEQMIERLQEGGAAKEDGRQMRLFLLRGPYGSGKKKQIIAAAGSLGHTALFMDMRALVCQKEDKMEEMVCDAVVRAVLNRAFLVVEHWETVWMGEGRQRQASLNILRKASVFFRYLFLTVEELPGEDILKGEYPQGYRVEEFYLRFPFIQERGMLWKSFLAASGGKPEEETVFARLAAQFDFSPGVIKEAAESACKEAQAQGATEVSASCLYRACRQKISHRLGERASRVNAVYTWDDLVLEEGAKELLRQACGQVTCRGKVYEEWGFEQKVAYGRGVSLLFAGPPGTGKTMAAQVLAKELNLELYKVDLSGVLSKYIGETQKNLREIFDEVKKSRSILFFDEADVLFGKRVDVTDARDISANAQTAYLLQKMEEYDGITILATNLMQNFDDAYKRRMKFIIRFTFPRREQRMQLWQKVFPAQMPLAADIDIDYLADNFELSGANIKNIALNAAFIAASRQEITGMEHIMEALQQEYEKSGKILGKAELKEYYIYKKQFSQPG